MKKWQFRGWDAVGHKKWVYGDLVHNQKVTETGLVPRVMVGGYEVNPKSVGVCLGVTDRHGMVIYEGDIIKLDHYQPCDEGVVKYINGTFCIVGEGGITRIDECCTKDWVLNGNIIGTKYERGRV